jgi:putative oxidoreductase
MTNKYEIGGFILRLILGIIFFVHGLEKFQGGLGNTAGFFESVGIPGCLAYVVAVIELVGGLALIVGIGTRIASALIGCIMLGAIITVKGSLGLSGGYEFDLALLAMSVYLVISGSRLYAVDALFGNKKSGQGNVETR